uniref:Uncharacterized protein n=1 Tax=uncultured marine virus TaxID=186617 RepID=A0A0F7L6J7_9VIRU|nr:hypothetical protein [uncultured marine virus]
MRGRRTRRRVQTMWRGQGRPTTRLRPLEAVRSRGKSRLAPVELEDVVDGRSTTGDVDVASKKFVTLPDVGLDDGVLVRGLQHAGGGHRLGLVEAKPQVRGVAQHGVKRGP